MSHAAVEGSDNDQEEAKERLVQQGKVGSVWERERATQKERERTS